MHRILLAALSATLLTLAACENKPSAGGDGMSAADKAVVGKWVIDVEAQKNAWVEKRKASGTEVTPGMAAEMEKDAQEMNFELELKSDHTFVVTGKAGERDLSVKGTWSFADDKYKIVTTEENGKVKEKPEEGYAKLKDGRLTIYDGDDPEMIFRKKA
jgi:hypothetical protein